MRTKFFIAAASACVMLALAPITHAQNFPNKPVRLVDPYAPGGSTSVVSQSLSKKFQEFSDQPMVIDYRPGAGSNIGSDIVAKATPDGYTVLIGTSSLAINPHLYRSMPFDPIKDLTPIAQLIRTPNVLAVNPALPVRTTAELIAYARANPGKLNYGSSGNGATNHMAMELFKTLAKVDIQHVPFKGGSEALAALEASISRSTSITTSCESRSPSSSASASSIASTVTSSLSISSSSSSSSSSPSSPASSSP